MAVHRQRGVRVRFVQGLLLGISIGGLVAQAADVLRPYGVGVAVVCFVLFGLLSIWEQRRHPEPAAARRAAQRSRSQLATARRASAPTAPTAPAGFLAGRRLGDALAWLAAEHGVSTLERVGVTEESVVVLFPGPQGPRLAGVSEQGAGFAVEFPDLPADVGSPFPGAGRFQARDVAPDVIPRALERARRERPDTWAHVQDAEALVHRPDRLRDEVTVLLHNGSPTGADQTLWASASGDLLYVQESLS